MADSQRENRSQPRAVIVPRSRETTGSPSGSYHSKSRDYDSNYRSSRSERDYRNDRDYDSDSRYSSDRHSPPYRRESSHRVRDSDSYEGKYSKYDCDPRFDRSSSRSPPRDSSPRDFRREERSYRHDSRDYDQDSRFERRTSQYDDDFRSRRPHDADDYPRRSQHYNDRDSPKRIYDDPDVRSHRPSRSPPRDYNDRPRYREVVDDMRSSRSRDDLDDYRHKPRNVEDDIAKPRIPSRPTSTDFKLSRSSSRDMSSSTDDTEIEPPKRLPKFFGSLKETPFDLITPMEPKVLKPIQPLCPLPHGSRLLRVVADQFCLGLMLEKRLRQYGQLTRFANLSYNTAFAEFSTVVSAQQANANVERLRETDKRLQHYHSSRVSNDEIAPQIYQRDSDKRHIYDPPKVMVCHNVHITSRPHMTNFFEKPFDVTNWEVHGTSVVTYHRTEASVKDFLLAFQERMSNLPNTYVTEGCNINELIPEVIQIVIDKLVESSLADFNDLLIGQVYSPTLRRAHIKRRVQQNLRARVPRAESGFTLYASQMPLCFYLSPPPRRNIQEKIKERTISLRSEMGEHELMISLMEKNPKLNIAQPHLDAPCSRLASITHIDEKSKRPYLRPYAEERVRIYVKTRGNKTHFQESQFPPNIEGFQQNQAMGKRIYFEKSKIQGWGLFALEPISPDTLVCEYNGTRVRSRVADHLEKYYEKHGYPHMYLFRIDADTVIDATVRGGLARYFNHSCVPNCRANVVPSSSTQIISFYSKELIHPHEELTFNYEMEFESDRSKATPCYCGSNQCLGYLNYCDDEQVRRKRELLSQIALEDENDELTEDDILDYLMATPKK